MFETTVLYASVLTSVKVTTLNHFSVSCETPMPLDSQCITCVLTLDAVNFKEMEVSHSDRSEREEEGTEEEEAPSPPKPVAPDSMFIFKASNP